MLRSDHVPPRRRPALWLSYLIAMWRYLTDLLR